VLRCCKFPAAPQLWAAAERAVASPLLKHLQFAIAGPNSAGRADAIDQITNQRLAATVPHQDHISASNAMSGSLDSELARMLDEELASGDEQGEPPPVEHAATAASDDSIGPAAAAAAEQPAEDAMAKRRRVIRPAHAGSSGSAAASVCPPHPGYMNGMCFRCGALKTDDAEAAGASALTRITHLHHTAHLEVRRRCPCASELRSCSRAIVSSQSKLAGLSRSCMARPCTNLVSSWRQLWQWLRQGAVALSSTAPVSDVLQPGCRAAVC
jgi:hypothetical protein